MNTGVLEDDKKIDMFIKEGKNGTIKDFPHQKMYYPPIPSKEKPKSLWQMIKELF